MLELGSQKNKEEALEMLQMFFLESPYNQETYNPKKVSMTYDNLIEDLENSMILLCVDKGEYVGILVATSNEGLWNSEKTAFELVWYMKPEYRGRGGLELLKAFEYWGKNVVKAQKLVLAHLNNEKVSKLYSRKGYVKTEESWSKGI